MFRKFGETQQIQNVVELTGRFINQSYDLRRLILWKNIIKYQYFIPFDGGWFDYTLIYIKGNVIFYHHGITNPIFKGNIEDLERYLKIYFMENKLGKGRSFYEISKYGTS